MDTNPTPRAYLGGLYINNKNDEEKNPLRKIDLKYNGRLIYNQQEEKISDSLYRKIDSITTTCSKLYFNKILKRLAEKNQQNTSIICDYIIAEET